MMAFVIKQLYTFNGVHNVIVIDLTKSNQMMTVLVLQP